MKLGILFSGGKDSMYAAWLARQEGYKIGCLITIISENPDSYMFHTPSIKRVREQAKIMDIPLIEVKTKGIKEEELDELEKAINRAIKEYEIQGVVTGAVESVYQSSRIQRICNKLQIECFNPLWQKDQFELLDDLVKNGFDVIITGVFADGLGKEWMGRKVDREFINNIKELNEKLGINPAGEGGEYESFVVNCPLFKRRLDVKCRVTSGKDNSWRAEVDVNER